MVKMLEDCHVMLQRYPHDTGTQLLQRHERVCLAMEIRTVIQKARTVRTR
jgi:hypothetical protein